MTYQGAALQAQQPAPRIEWHDLPREIRDHVGQHQYCSCRMDEDTAVVRLDADYGDDETRTYRREGGRWVLRSVFTERNMGR